MRVSLLAGCVTYQKGCIVHRVVSEFIHPLSLILHYGCHLMLGLVGEKRMCIMQIARLLQFKCPVDLDLSVPAVIHMSLVFSESPKDQFLFLTIAEIFILLSTFVSVDNLLTRGHRGYGELTPLTSCPTCKNLSISDLNLFPQCLKRGTGTPVTCAPVPLSTMSSGF